ncbi:MAG: thioredoxin family protein [Promethearchaeota archaeon]
MIEKVNGKSDFESKKDSAKVTIFDFSAVWCGPCRILDPILEDLYEDYMKNNADVKFFSIDVDENRDLAMQFQIMAVPSVAVFKDGKQAGDLIIGVREYETYKNIIDDLLG